LSDKINDFKVLKPKLELELKGNKVPEAIGDKSREAVFFE